MSCANFKKCCLRGGECLSATSRVNDYIDSWLTQHLRHIGSLRHRSPGSGPRATDRYRAESINRWLQPLFRFPGLHRFEAGLVTAGSQVLPFVIGSRRKPARIRLNEQIRQFCLVATGFDAIHFERAHQGVDQGRCFQFLAEGIQSVQ